MPLQKPKDKWFLDWVLRSPKEVSGHLTAGYLAYEAVADIYNGGQIQSAREYFGGMGAQTLMIQELLAPVEHTVLDYSPDAVTHMTDVVLELDADIVVKQADSYDPSSCFPADLVGLDIGDLTAWRTRDGEMHRGLLDRVFAHRPKAVVLTDIAGPRLHLQRERYETLLGLGTCRDYESYLNAFADRLEDLYGYEVQAGYHHRWSSVLALVPKGMSTLGIIAPVPSSPVGLELL